jgi:hypothetical protein
MVVVVVMVMVVIVVLSQLHASASLSAPSIVGLECRDRIWDRGKQVLVARSWSKFRLN